MKFLSLSKHEVIKELIEMKTNCRIGDLSKESAAVKENKGQEREA